MTRVARIMRARSKIGAFEFRLADLIFVTTSTNRFGDRRR